MVLLLLVLLELRALVAAMCFACFVRRNGALDDSYQAQSLPGPDSTGHQLVQQPSTNSLARRVMVLICRVDGETYTLV